MDRLKKLQNEIEKIKARWRELNIEIEKCQLSDLNLPGKYFYSEIRGVYIHVKDAWIGREEGRLELSGETISYCFDDEECFF